MATAPPPPPPPPTTTTPAGTGLDDLQEQEQQQEQEEEGSSESSSMQRTTRALVAVGNAVIDHTVTASKWQGSPLRPGEHVSGWPREKKIAAIRSVRNTVGVFSKVGGSALNTARVAKRAAGDGDLHVAFIGGVGQDEAAMLVRDACTNSKVNPLLVEDTSGIEETGQCAVVVDDVSRDRSIVCDRGAAGILDETKIDLLGSRLPWKQGMETLVFATAFNFTTHGRRAAVTALARGRSLALSLSSASLLNRSPEVKLQIDSLLSDTSCIFMNGEELAVYAKQAKWDQNAPQSSHARSLAGLLSSSGLVFVTNGAQATVVAQQDASMEFPVPKVSHVEGDTTGAGDSFAGGVLACILLARQNITLKQHLASIDLQGSLIAEAVAKGTALAGASLQHQGIEE